MLGKYLRDLPPFEPAPHVEFEPAPPVEAEAPPEVLTTPPESAPEVEEYEAEEHKAEEYEFVLGRRQLASVSLVGLVILTIFSSVSYLAGRWTTSKGFSARTSVVHAASETSHLPAGIATAKEQSPQPAGGGSASHPAAQATALPPAANSAPASEVPATEPPVYGEPVPGTFYLQMAAVDRGVAHVMVNGLRRLGFRSIVSVGPNDHAYRVMVGPLADAATLASTRTALEAFGLTLYAKRIDPPKPGAKPFAEGAYGPMPKPPDAPSVTASNGSPAANPGPR